MAAALMAWPMSVSADEFDLTSQRGEIQQFNKVPGHKVDHKGLVINPTPHSIEHPYTGILNASGGFKVVDKQKAFAGDLGFLRQEPKGLKLTIDFGEKAAKKAGVKDVSGAYLLNIGPKDVTITGYDERGAFYGLQTLRQILESDVAKGGDELPMMVINDYPDLPYRGVVEGFYGTPWSHEVRLSLIDFYGRNKMNDYIFGPKDDPYHSSPHWRQPYPEDQAKKIKELVEACKRNRVNFVWAIHPGQDIRWNKEDYDSLVGKLNMMYDLGVRSFAVFFDDISGIGTDSHKQAALINDLTRDFVDKKGDVTNIMICPTDYTELWANPKPTGQLATYGNELNPKAEVFWTGKVVCADLTPETMEFVNSRIKRPALFWWNFPVTDYCRNIILQGPTYGLDPNLTANEVAGIESNPMEHGEASKLALYGVADYAWNTKAYNPIDNWERGLEYLMPNAAEAYRTFAIHSADTETGYRRDESWETQTFPYNDYTPAQFNALRAEFEKVAAAPALIRQGSTNAQLLKEIDPWLTEFGKLGQRGLRTLDLIKTFEAGNDSIFWGEYLDNLMTTADREAYQAHKSGTMKLQPFYEKAMDAMLYEYYKNLTGTLPAIYHGISSFPNIRTTQSKLMLDNDTTTYYTSAASQRPDSWIGIDLGEVVPVRNVNIHQGRNSVDDVDYFEHVVLEVSPDGKNWTALTDSLKNTYIIDWAAEPVDGRYVRLRRLPSGKRNYAAIRTFNVNTPTQESLGLNLEGKDTNAAMAAFDRNPSTPYNHTGDISFDRRPDAKAIILLTGRGGSPLTITQYDKKGKVLGTNTVSGPFATVNFDEKATRCTLNGVATIYEIVQK
ncbi:MAG: beta-N-acetylglucosaminidase domain-containing protein [Muribaculaceae bacterium]|nr:beta-N-acetylglucosaminidase domain-containing protein [Muribaculaceae bacterium]